LVAGVALAKAYEALPSPANLETKELFPDGDNALVGETLEWLFLMGYLRRHGGAWSYWLTDKGLAALNAVPPELGGESFADQLVEAAKEVGKGAAANTIADLVGRLFGAVLKGMAAE
jgi:hypothetical protein